MRRFLLAVVVAVAVVQPALATERWETLPPTPAPSPPIAAARRQVNGISIHYAIYGEGRR